MSIVFLNEKKKETEECFCIGIRFILINSLTMSFSSDEVNFLVYRYLQESGKENKTPVKKLKYSNHFADRYEGR